MNTIDICRWAIAMYKVNGVCADIDDFSCSQCLLYQELGDNICTLSQKGSGYNSRTKIRLGLAKLVLIQNPEFAIEELL